MAFPFALILGAAQVGLGLAGLFSKQDDNPYDKALAELEQDYLNKKREMIDRNMQLGTAKETNVANKSMMAGSVAGVSNPERVSAGVTAEIYDKRDTAISEGIQSQDYIHGQMKASLLGKKAELDAQNPPFLARLISSAPGLIQGGTAMGYGISDLLKGSSSISPKFPTLGKEGLTGLAGNINKLPTSGEMLTTSEGLMGFKPSSKVNPLITGFTKIKPKFRPPFWSVNQGEGVQ